MSDISKTGIEPLGRDPRAIALLMAATLSVMANATISPALAGLAARFSGQPGSDLLTRMLVPAPSLAVVLLAPVVGIMADRFGHSRLLVAGIALFAVAGSAGFYLPDLTWIFASRLLLGVAVAIVMTTQTALIGTFFQGARRNTFMGWQISARNFGGLVFIGLAGVLAGYSPRFPFALYALAGIYVPYVWFAVKGQAVPGRATGEPDGQASPGKPAWLWPIVMLTALKMLTIMIFFMMPTQLPFFVAGLGLDSASSTAFGLGALTLSGGVVALFYGAIHRRLGSAGTFGLGYLLFAIGFGCLAAGGTLASVLIGTAFVGAGYAILVPNFIGLALRLAPEQRRGAAAGVLMTGVYLGQFLSPAAITPVIEIHGYETVFGAAAFVVTVLAVISCLSTFLRPGALALSEGRP